jgi:Uma2 family endonuclease
MQTSVDLLSLDEFIRLYEQEGPFEIIDGESKSLMPPVALHNLIVRGLFRVLDALCGARGLGEVFTEMPFVLTYDAQWVKGARVPDLVFITAQRWQQYVASVEDWALKPIILVPDLVVEVVSANDLYTDIQDKVEHYLDDGVRLVWVVDPMRKRVMVYEGEQYRILNAGDTLTAEQLLPQLQLKLDALFNIATSEE